MMKHPRHGHALCNKSNKLQRGLQAQDLVLVPTDTYLPQRQNASNQSSQHSDDQVDILEGLDAHLQVQPKTSDMSVNKSGLCTKIFNQLSS